MEKVLRAEETVELVLIVGLRVDCVAQLPCESKVSASTDLPCEDVPEACDNVR